MCILDSGTSMLSIFEMSPVTVPMIHGHHWPNFIDCDTNEGQTLNISGYALQSWHNITMKVKNDSETQGFPTQHWITINGKTMPGEWKIFATIGGSTFYIDKNRTNGVLSNHIYTARVCLGGQYEFMWGRKDKVSIVKSVNSTLQRTKKDIYSITCFSCKVSECIDYEASGVVFIITQPKYVLMPVKTKGIDLEQIAFSGN